ncbi:CDP-alcohol phosphatidyltransferase family protein [Patescibacteria group bacterium]
MEKKNFRHYIPNTLSYIRLTISFVIIVLYFVAHPLWVIQALVVAGIVSDKLDGTLARLWKTDSEWGKKLESVIDPTFITASIIYCTFLLDFPQTVFYLAVVGIVLISLGRILIQLKTKKMFYEKSQLTRYGVGLTFILLLLYVFQIPYRDWVAWASVVYGFVVTANYLRLMYNYMKKYYSTKKAAAS